MKKFILSCLFSIPAFGQVTYQISTDQVKLYPKIIQGMSDAMGTWNRQASLHLGDGPKLCMVKICDIQAPPLNLPMSALAGTVPDGVNCIIYVDDELEKQNLDYITNTMIHEIGHTLGLSHSSNYKSVMYPYNDPNKINLDQEDISRVRSILISPDKSISSFSISLLALVRTLVSVE